MARPTKLTPATEKAIMEALRAGSTRTAAAEAAMIPRETLSRWMARNVTFRHAVFQAEAQAEVYATVKVRQAIDAGSWRAAFLWLERRRSSDWGRRVTLDVADDIRALVKAAGLDDDVADEAIAEAQDILKRARHA